MGEGNAIHHLMPPPFYAHRFVVAKARAPEESIQDQIDKIETTLPAPSAGNRAKIEVMPGIYPETITMAPYVDVVAPYGRAVIQPPSGTAGVTMASNCMLQGMEVDCTNQGATATGVVFPAAVTSSYMEDCWITNGGAGDIGVSDATTGSTVIIRKCRIDSAATGYKKTGTGTTWFYENRVTAQNNGTDIDIDDGTLNAYENDLMCQGTGYNIDVAVTGAGVTTVNSFSNTLANTNTTGASWRIANDADAKVYSHDDIFTRVVHSGVGFMVAFEEPQTYLVYNGMHIADALTNITDASDTKRYVIRVFPGEYSEAATVTMKQYVDIVGSSNESCVISQAATNVITAAADSRIKNVRVELTAGDGKYGIYCNNVYAYIEEVVFVITRVSGVNYGVGSAGTGGFEIHDSVITCSNANDYPIGVDGSGNHYVYDSELINTAASAYSVFVGSADVLNSFNNKLRSVAGFYLTSNAATTVLSWDDDFTTVVWSGATGLFADLSGCRLYTCAAGLAIGEWVYASANDTVALVDADALATMPTIGVIVYKPSTTTCYVKNAGYYYDAAVNAGHGDAFVAGEEYWVSATAGQITTTMHPVWPQRAGVALSTQRFKVLIGDNLGLVHCNEYTSDAGVAVNEWVYISGNATCNEAKADAAGTMGSIGVVVLKITATRALVKLRGKYAKTDAGAAWVASDDVYISDATEGTITRTIPVMGIIQKVAEVYSYIDPALILELAD